MAHYTRWKVLEAGVLAVFFLGSGVWDIGLSVLEVSGFVTRFRFSEVEGLVRVWDFRNWGLGSRVVGGP